jgi:hypothetical protein
MLSGLLSDHGMIDDFPPSGCKKENMTVPTEVSA